MNLAPSMIDFFYWLAFFGGQLLFLLKRSDIAVRSPLNALQSRTAFFTQNWVILLFRTAIEFVFPFYLCRHVSATVLIAAMGWTLPAWVQLPQNWVFYFCLGILSDTLMDWAAMQDKVLGIPIPAIIKETIPQLPQVQNMVAEIKKQNGK